MKYVLGMIILCILAACGTDNTVSFSGETMGTWYNIKIISADLDQDQQNELKNDIDERLILVNNQMSTYIESSEISRFNQSPAETPFKVSKSFMQVLSLASQITAESAGAFDVTVMPVVNLWGFGRAGRRDEPPSEADVLRLKHFVGMDKITIKEDSILKSHAQTELDFSAIAKGYGVDEVAGLLQQKGFKNYMVEIGGEVVVKGENGKGGLWKIGIDRPDIEPAVERNFEAILKISDLAIATSGDYRNYFISGDSLYSHTIDPVTCRPIVNGVASVTVIAPTCALADAMATAIMVMGETRGLEWVESKAGVETMIIVRQQDRFRISASSGFDSFVDKKK
jgi:FAD:protein FMN transferase